MLQVEHTVTQVTKYSDVAGGTHSDRGSDTD